MIALGLALSSESLMGSSRGATAATHLACCGLTWVFTSPLCAAMLFAVRRSEAVRPGLLGAALGATAALWGALFVWLHCPYSQTAHLLLGHVAPLAVPALVAGVLGTWIARPR